MRKKMKKIVAVGTGVLAIGTAQMAHAQVTLPTPLGDGVTMGDYVTAAITSVGTVVAVAVGGTIAFKVVRAGLAWVGRGIR